MGMKFDAPLVCPFCDEVAYQKKGARRIFLPHKIYMPRKCIMGHEFYSVEEVPENQSEIMEEIKQIRKDARAWNMQLKAQYRLEYGKYTK